MFNLSSASRYYLYTFPVDMRKGINGLTGIALIMMGRQPKEGESFVFVNRPKNRIKIIHYREKSVTLYQRRLEQGVLQLRLTKEEFALITYRRLLKIVRDVKRRKRGLF